MQKIVGWAGCKSPSIIGLSPSNPFNEVLQLTAEILSNAAQVAISVAKLVAILNGITSFF